MVGNTKMATACMAAFALAACTTMREVPDWHSSLHAGDHVRVTTHPAGRIDLEIVRITSEGLEGRMAGDTGITALPVERIDTVERRQISALRTTGLALGILIGIGLAQAATAPAAILDAAAP